MYIDVLCRHNGLPLYDIGKYLRYEPRSEKTGHYIGSCISMFLQVFKYLLNLSSLCSGAKQVLFYM